MESIGDMARTLVLRSNQTRLRAEMDVRAVEIATGFSKDPTKKLGGDITGLLAVDRSLARLEAYRVATTEAVFVTSTMQNALEEIQTRSEIVSQSLISADLTPTQPLLSSMADNAQSALSQSMGALNRTVAGRTLFAGTGTNGPAVASTETLIAEARTAITGLTTKVDIEAALDTFFATAGGFDALIYQGSNTGLAAVRLSDTEEAAVDIRANNDAFKAVLKPLVMASLADDPSLNLEIGIQVELLSQSGRDLLAAQQPMVELRSNLGSLEARIEESATRNATERTATNIARVDLVGIDPFDTATRYENIRSQLESLYAITARSQRLSLAEYL